MQLHKKPLTIYVEKVEIEAAEPEVLQDLPNVAAALFGGGKRKKKCVTVFVVPHFFSALSPQ